MGHVVIGTNTNHTVVNISRRITDDSLHPEMAPGNSFPALPAELNYPTFLGIIFFTRRAEITRIWYLELIRNWKSYTPTRYKCNLLEYMISLSKWETLFLMYHRLVCFRYVFCHPPDKGGQIRGEACAQNYTSPHVCLCAGFLIPANFFFSLHFFISPTQWEELLTCVYRVVHGECGRGCLPLPPSTSPHSGKNSVSNQRPVFIAAHSSVGCSTQLTSNGALSAGPCQSDCHNLSVSIIHVVYITSLICSDLSGPALSLYYIQVTTGIKFSVRYLNNAKVAGSL